MTRRVMGDSLTHFFTFFSSLGGVESVLREHPEQDRARGIQSRVLAFFESGRNLPKNVEGLGWTGFRSIRRARGSISAWRRRNSVDLAVYHNTWGLPFLADLDGAERRIGIIHSDWPNQERHLRAQAGRLDGLCCVSMPLVNQARRALPNLDHDRIRFIPYPIGACPLAVPDRTPLNTRPMRIGLVGRLVKEQKRVDRIPPLLRRLSECGMNLPVEMEVLGDGAMRPWLEQQCDSHAGNRSVTVQFRGRLSGEAYWQALSRWDAILFVSDYEGLPISMLEAMSLGVLPICPNVGSGGDDYARRVSEDLIYPPGDMDALTNVIRHLPNLAEDHVLALRRQARDLAKPHVGENYYDVFAEFARQIRTTPRISRLHAPRRVRALDYCPFGLLRRLHPDRFWDV